MFTRELSLSTYQEKKRAKLGGKIEIFSKKLFSSLFEQIPPLPRSVGEDARFWSYNFKSKSSRSTLRVLRLFRRCFLTVLSLIPTSLPILI